MSGNGLPSNYGDTTAVYTALVGGLQVGMYDGQVNTWRQRIFVQNNPSGSTIAIGAALKFTAGSASSYEVDATTGTGDVCVGINDAAGATIPAGSYFWMTVRGFCKPLVLNGVTQGQVLAPSATTGVLQQSAGDFQGNISAAAAQSGGGNTQTLCWMA